MLSIMFSAKCGEVKMLQFIYELYFEIQNNCRAAQNVFILAKQRKTKARQKATNLKMFTLARK